MRSLLLTAGEVPADGLLPEGRASPSSAATRGRVRLIGAHRATCGAHGLTHVDYAGGLTFKKKEPRGVFVRDLQILTSLIRMKRALCANSSLT